MASRASLACVRRLMRAGFDCISYEDVALAVQGRRICYVGPVSSEVWEDMLLERLLRMLILSDIDTFYNAPPWASLERP